MVEAIFGVEEGARLPPVLRAAFRKHTDIAASAEATAFATVDDHRLDGGIPAPPDERVDHRLAHRQVKRVNRLGARSRPATDAAAGAAHTPIGHWPRTSPPPTTRNPTFS